MSIKSFINPDFQTLLSRHGFTAFDGLWDLEAGWFEAPNKRRGGWSGVSKCAWDTGKGNQIQVFLKRQENHNAKTWRHPIKGVPTFAREMDNILQYQKYHIPTLNPVFFAWRNFQGNDQAMLVTEALEGYQSLEDWIKHWQDSGWPNKTQREVVMVELARVLRLLHQNKLQHNCMYPKHLFMQWVDDKIPNIKIIDLEKTRPKATPKAMLRDLSSLYRHLGVRRIRDQLSFLRHYLGLSRITPEAKAIWREIDLRVQKKTKT